MFKMLLRTVIVAAVGALMAHSCHLGDLPAPEGDSEQTESAKQEGNASAASVDAELGRCIPEAPSGESAIRAALNACLLEAAMSSAVAGQEPFPLRQAAFFAAQLGNPDLAHALLMLASAEGDGLALLAIARQDPPTKDAWSDELAAQFRVEAARLALSMGASGASAELEAARERLLQGQGSLHRPEVVMALMEGNGAEVEDTFAMRRYLTALAEGLVSSCPFQRASFTTASFVRDLEQFSAPARAQGQERLLRGVWLALGETGESLWRFGRRLGTGDGYGVAAEGAMRELSGIHQRLNQAAARGSERGAQDAVEVLRLAGGDCASPGGTRLVRGLTALLAMRARHPIGHQRDRRLERAIPWPVAQPIDRAGTASPPAAEGLMALAESALAQRRLGRALFLREQAWRLDPVLKQKFPMPALADASQKEASLVSEGMRHAQRRDLQAFEHVIDALLSLDVRSASVLELVLWWNTYQGIGDGRATRFIWARDLRADAA